MDTHATVQLGSLQQKHTETTRAVEHLRRETSAAQQALIQALQAEGTASVGTSLLYDLHLPCKLLHMTDEQQLSRCLLIGCKMLLNTQQAS